ncbi:MAG: RHS repeat protein [Dehalococcoidia bacterium]|nr:RHS repeat protein [Dehalococcoidia bacterium]
MVSDRAPGRAARLEAGIAPRHDAANRPTTVTDWPLDSTTYAYDDARRMTSSTLPTGTGVVSTQAYVVGHAERSSPMAERPCGAIGTTSIGYKGSCEG